jgi:hypothetical protein
VVELLKQGVGLNLFPRMSSGRKAIFQFSLPFSSFNFFFVEVYRSFTIIHKDTPLNKYSTRHKNSYQHNIEKTPGANIYTLCLFQTRDPNNQNAADLRLGGAALGVGIKILLNSIKIRNEYIITTATTTTTTTTLNNITTTNTTTATILIFRHRASSI